MVPGGLPIVWNDGEAKRRAREVGLKALHDAGEIILKESQQEVPHATGELESHGDIHDAFSENAVVIFYTGPYSVRQHEDASLRHPDPTNPASRSGRKDHYLEDPFNRNASKVQQLVSARLNAALR